LLRTRNCREKARGTEPAMFRMAFLPRSVTDFSAVLCLVYYRLRLRRHLSM
jgi:hypothetical protein